MIAYIYTKTVVEEPNFRELALTVGAATEALEEAGQAYGRTEEALVFPVEPPEDLDSHFKEA